MIKLLHDSKPARKHGTLVMLNFNSLQQGVFRDLTLNCVQTCAVIFCCYDSLDLSPMTWKLDRNISPHQKTKFLGQAIPKLSQNKYDNSSQGQGQGQMSPTFNHFRRSPYRHIPTKYHQVLISSFRDFVWTVRCIDRHCQNNTCLQHARR